jgi:multiple sugar transport system ATP-binding protein
MQFATPDEIYHAPANEFVASFVGEPPMSFLDVTLVIDGPAPRLAITGTEAHPVTVSVGETAAQFFRQRPVPKSLRIGARATALSLSSSQSDTHAGPAEVYVVETLGHRDIVTVKVGPHLVKVMEPSGMRRRVGDTVWLNLSPQTYHLFGDELAIAHPIQEAYSPEGA